MQGKVGTVGYISEVFTSIQGEGVKVGQRQTFVRFRGCNFSCDYCDTPESQRTKGALIIGERVYQNPVSADFLLEKVMADEVAITGGEPLLQIDFLIELCGKLLSEGRKIYLDTNGTLPGELEKIIKYVDWVALDFKIPTATGRPAQWTEHGQCLEVASQKNVFIKMVINENLLPRELDKTCSIIERVNRKAPLIIQPVFGQSVPNILEVQRKALTRLRDVRIIPQVHKCLYLR